MRTYRFLTTIHHDVLAETLDEAIVAFNEMKRQGLSLGLDTVSRIEVQDEHGEFITVDRPLRAGDLDAHHEGQTHLSA
jgi:hypothetical protein